ADPPADPGALDRRQVDAVLAGELAYQRRDVGDLLAVGLLGRLLRSGRLGLWSRFRLRFGPGLRLALRLGLLRRCGLRRRRRRSRRTDHRKLRADLDGLVLGDLDLQQRSRGGCRYLGVDLVGRHFEQRLVGFDLVALVLEPAGDRTLRDALA